MNTIKQLGLGLILLFLTTNCLGQSLKVRPTLNNIKGTTLTLDQISELTELKLTVPYSLRIVSFNLVIAPRKDSAKVASNIGPKLSTTSTNWIKTLQVGDRILLDEIMVKTPSGETKQTLSKIYDIKDIPDVDE
jgi:hypothetical protein